MFKKMIAQKKKVSKDNFISIIREKWERIDKTVIANSINSMQNRVQACIDAEAKY